jgi:ATP-dependent DNA helicase RecQ
LVRIYPNITETAQSVDGSQLSKRTGIGLDQLKVHFAALEKNGYAAISSWNCDTRLFFLEPREDEHILTRAITHLDQSLETRKVQLKAVQDYVENDKQCKQALLLDYFGETGKTACEHCSTCQSTPNAAQLQSSIMAILQKKPASAKNLSKLLVTEEKTIIASLMEMLNEERIFQKDLLFYINK